MSADAGVNLTWGDGEERKYRLGYGEIEELQEKVARVGMDKKGNPVPVFIGPFKLYAALCEGDWLAGDVFQTLRLGLIGGGMTPVAAKRFLDKYIFRDPREDVTAAARVLMAWIEGAKDDPVPKPDGEKDKEAATAAAGSSSPRSTEPLPRSA